MLLKVVTLDIITHFRHFTPFFRKSQDTMNEIKWLKGSFAMRDVGFIERRGDEGARRSMRRDFTTCNFNKVQALCAKKGRANARPFSNPLSQFQTAKRK